MLICLSDGTQVHGKSFGSEKFTSGEIVFTTGMVGYVEALTDPSFFGQILIFSYPMIGNYYCPDNPEPIEYESTKIQVAGIIVQEQCADDPTMISLDKWLKTQDVPGIYGVDTRDLIIKLRNQGTMTACITTDPKHTQFQPITNHVQRLNIKALEYKASNEKPKLLYIDCGGKKSQISQLKRAGFINIKYAIWSDTLDTSDIDAIYISSGPGNPQDLQQLIDNVKQFPKNIPIFGICLGHQILALATGLNTIKMKYGNRGFNQPVVDLIAKSSNLPIREAYITSQNHGYAVECTDSDWVPWFSNLNDHSNEGMIHNKYPWMSVQFHPEAAGGPLDTTWLFDMWWQYIGYYRDNPLSAYDWYQKIWLNNITHQKIPPKNTAKKILLLGSGGLCIGQAGEFDYSGTQAIKACKSEGKQVVLINPNIATVQTMEGLADKVYFLPITPEYVNQVIRIEQPDSVLLQFGGQTALNCGVQMESDFEAHHIQILGTSINTIKASESREQFKRELDSIRQPYVPSVRVKSIEQGISAISDIGGYPVIARAEYTLGGLGSGFAHNEQELRNILEEGFGKSESILIDKSIRGWRELEYEVVRDAYGNAVVVCNMENIDAMGIHTGESMVVAPSQTLDDRTYFILRDVAIKVMEQLKVIGEANIQFAIPPNNPNWSAGETLQYYIIEVNARLSRSSALASKATGYPLAYIAAKIALGYKLTDLSNLITQKTSAYFEPALDYIVCKIPRWDLNKFAGTNTTLSSCMKSVGEVMAIGRNFEETFQKALRMVNEISTGFVPGVVPFVEQDLRIETPHYRRGLMLADALYRGISVATLNEWTGIHPWFLNKMHNIIHHYQHPSRTSEYILKAKQLGFSDKTLSQILGTMENEIYNERTNWQIVPKFKRIDTVAGEFPSHTNYFYTTYNASANDEYQLHNSEDATRSVIVLGSGTYRIGSSVEFDWCAVNCVKTLRKLGIRAIMINYNPETVSTDFDECDTLWFDELTIERIREIYQIEKPLGVIVSMSGQIANNIALRLQRSGLRILGTDPEKIDNAENRYKFSRLCDTLDIDQPKWKECKYTDQVVKFAHDVGYPVLVRPSFVLSGAGMRIIYTEPELRNYITSVYTNKNPVVVSKFVVGAQEFDLDIVVNRGDILIYALSEHVENAGVHSGDATLMLPCQNISREIEKKMLAIAGKIAQSLFITGPMNIQFLVKEGEIMVIECNVRASRSFPFVSKTLQHNFIEIATCAILKSIIRIDSIDLKKSINVSRMTHVGIKAPMFSFERLSGVDPITSVDMASTGEIACFGYTKYEAFIKAFQATGGTIPQPGSTVLLSLGSLTDKQMFINEANYLSTEGYYLLGSHGTASFLKQYDINIVALDWSDIFNKIDEIQLFICTREFKPEKQQLNTHGFQIRRQAITRRKSLITNIHLAKLLVASMQKIDIGSLTSSIDRIHTKELPIVNIKVPTIISSCKIYQDDTDIIDPIVVSCSDFNRAKLHRIFDCAFSMKQRHLAGDTTLQDLCKGRVLGLIFTEHSTRTFFCFYSAMSRLGGTVLPVHGLQNTSSNKGETIQDTIRTIASYADGIVFRSKDRISVNMDLIKSLQMPFINAGDGDGEHPTQALLDIFTIREELGTLNGLVITIIGDLKYGRTVHSLIKLLCLYEIAYLRFIPVTKELNLPSELIYYLRSQGIVFYTTIWDQCSEKTRRNLFADTDILYVTRLQKERFPDGRIPDGLNYVIDPSVLSECKEEMRILHPLPRDGELSEQLDKDTTRAAYFRQMKNGMYVRMALLHLLFKNI